MGDDGPRLGSTTGRAGCERHVPDDPAAEYETGVSREAYPGHLFADGQDRILETAWWIGTRAAWDASPHKAGGKYNSSTTGFGLVRASRTTGI